MDEDYILRKEHDEYCKRMDAEIGRLRDEDDRQNHRIGTLEETVRQISDLTVSVKEMAVSMKNMLAEQVKQGERLDSIEGRDGDKWRTVTSHIITAVVGAVLCFIFTHIGL